MVFWTPKHAVFEAGESLKNQRFFGACKKFSIFYGCKTFGFANIKNEAFKKSLDFLMFAK
ncbi:hypothetical protein A9507_03640 [Methanobacterium sp. A39]|uniref:Uncharacterized protein n=1 Tax=Methanobacterium bryantii TaxID=2161 RepID=A0A2A2H654_METBR|nr:hypothetical protein A9507_03640 [Methanobacterium sp. A39]PAV04794.1 hypothetical protein ASJ80_10805 [Methanobacterium bryantii]